MISLVKKTQLLIAELPLILFSAASIIVSDLAFAQNALPIPSSEATPAITPLAPPALNEAPSDITENGEERSTPPAKPTTATIPTPTQKPELPSNQKAFVITTTAVITREPKLGGTVVAELKQGEPVEVLDIQGNFTQVRYRIEGEYLVTGWLPVAVLSKPSKSVPKITDLGQSYVSESKAPVTTEVKEFPVTQMTEKVIVPQGSGQKLKLEAKKEAPPLPPPVSHHKEFGWTNEVSVQLGLQSWQESITSKQTSGTSFDGPFLDYSLSGATLQIHDVLDYKFPTLPISVGGDLIYRFTFFSHSVDSSNVNVAKSSIQAQFHEAEITPYIRGHFKLHPLWKLEPELGPTIGFHSFVTNHLHDVPPSTITRPGQAVLFGLTALYAKVSLRPTVRGPYNLRFTPDVSMLMFYSFSEYPTASDTTGVRTGEPDGAEMSLNYGFELGWGLEKFRAPNSEMVFSLLTQEYSRNYTGVGNRAGIQTLNASASNSMTIYSIGYRYLF
jgi:hypothetical protein